ncbi:MAG: cytochrome-c oxidase, cbb3-type subunit I, partial [Alteraurantiacibacter sp.]|nr:cytochrome-c oxidase, cbb3-type subunit I [Alteraurantiacibacter sp.]
RAFGGLLYIAGAVIMVYNIWMTIAGKQRDEAPLETARYNPETDRPLPRAPIAQAAE